MIPSLLLCIAAAQPAAEPIEADPNAGAPTDPPADPDAPVPPKPESLPPIDVDDSLSRFRAPLEVLAERMIGTASKPVAFDWRRSTVQVAATGSFYYELNNFNSVRGGLLVRAPLGGPMVELGASYVGVWDSPSSKQLALTPYRQSGRPARVEFDIALTMPLAEGVVTTAAKFLPPLQLVFNGMVDFRYALYPTGWGGMRPGQVGGAIFSPRMTDIEVDNLDEERLAAMQVDRGRYHIMVGFGNDVYSRSGLFIAPRFLIALPLLNGVSDSEMGFFADFTIAVGQSF